MRITEKDLELAANRLNLTTDNPKESYTGHGKSNIGNYHIDYAYGGTALYQISNEAGGARDIFNVGHVPRKELYRLIHAYIAGKEA